jgi:hypothetical protein
MIVWYIIIYLLVNYSYYYIEYGRLEHENKQLKECQSTWNTTLVNTRILTDEEIENKKIEKLEKNMRMINKEKCKAAYENDRKILSSPSFIPWACYIYFGSEYLSSNILMRFEERNPGYSIEFKEASWIGSPHYVKIIYKR